MENSGAGDGTTSSVFTIFVDSAQLQLLLKNAPFHDDAQDAALSSIARTSKKFKKFVRKTHWPINHEARRSLWIQLCNASYDCKIVCDESSYRESVHDIFGDGN